MSPDRFQARRRRTGSAIADVWPCDTTGFAPTISTNAGSSYACGTRVAMLVIRSATYGLATASSVSEVNLLVVPRARPNHPHAAHAVVSNPAALPWYVAIASGPPLASTSVNRSARSSTACRGVVGDFAIDARDRRRR